MAQTLFWWDAPTMAFQQSGWCSVPIWVVTSPVLKFWILVRGSKAAGIAKLESRLRPLVSQAAPLQQNIDKFTLKVEKSWKHTRSNPSVRNPLKPRYWSWRWKLGHLREQALRYLGSGPQPVMPFCKADPAWNSKSTKSKKTEVFLHDWPQRWQTKARGVFKEIVTHFTPWYCEHRTETRASYRQPFMIFQTGVRCGRLA